MHESLISWRRANFKRDGAKKLMNASHVKVCARGALSRKKKDWGKKAHTLNLSLASFRSQRASSLVLIDKVAAAAASLKLYLGELCVREGSRGLKTAHVSPLLSALVTQKVSPPQARGLFRGPNDSQNITPLNRGLSLKVVNIYDAQLFFRFFVE